MTGLTAIAYGLKCAAVLAAWLTARRSAGLRPVAWFLSWSFASDVTRLAIFTWAAGPAYAAFVAAGGDPVATPVPGVALAVLADRALFLTWAAGLAALAV